MSFLGGVRRDPYPTAANCSYVSYDHPYIATAGTSGPRVPPSPSPSQPRPLQDDDDDSFGNSSWGDYDDFMIKLYDKNECKRLSDRLNGKVPGAAAEAIKPSS